MKSSEKSMRCGWIAMTTVLVCVSLMQAPTTYANTVQQSPEPATDAPTAIEHSRPASAVTSAVTAAPHKHSSPASSAAKPSSQRSRTAAGQKPNIARSQAADAAPVVPGITAFPPERTVVRNGGAQDIRLQLTPTSTPEQALRQRRETRDLLSVSIENLKRISQQQLDSNQQDMLQEVHNYIEQATLADKAGELQRAQTLASKARQLSDDLAGVRTILKLWPW